MASLLDVVLAQRNPQMAGLLGRGPMVQQTTPAPTMPAIRSVQPQQRPAPAAPAPEDPSFLQRLGSVFGDTPEARREAMLLAGLSLVGNRGHDGPGLGQAIIAGRGAAAASAEKRQAKQQQQRVMELRESILSDPSLNFEQKYGRLLDLATMMGDKDQQEELRQALDDFRKDSTLTLQTVNGRSFFADRRGNLMEPGTSRPITAAVQEALDLSTEASTFFRTKGWNPDRLTPEQQAEFFDWWQAQRAAGATRVSVDARDPIVEGIDEIGLERLRSATETAESAAAMLGTLDQVEALLTETPTGKLEPALLPLRQLAGHFGLPTNAGAQETLRALSNQMALLARQNMPGALSDNDIKFLTQQVVSLSNTPDANRRILEIARKVAQHQARRASEMERFVSERKTGVGLNEHMRQWDQQNRTAGEATQPPAAPPAPNERRVRLRGILQDGGTP